MFSQKIIVALDSNNLKKTISLVKLLKRDVYAFKIGYQFFLNFGISGYKKIYSISPKIFLDLKLHDIPNTVKNGIEAINKLKPLFTTVAYLLHCLIDLCLDNDNFCVSLILEPHTFSRCNI